MKRKTYIKTSEKGTHWSKISEVAIPGGIAGHRVVADGRVRRSRRGGGMEYLEDLSVGPQMDTFLIIESRETGRSMVPRESRLYGGLAEFRSGHKRAWDAQCTPK